MRAICILVTACSVALAPVSLGATQQQVTSAIEVQALKSMAEAIPPGTRVKVQTTAGKRLSGTLMTTTDQAIILKKNTRLPEPAVTVRYDELARLEREQRGGINAGKAIGVGLAAGAGAILTLIAIFASISD
jgi:hypothetical protein